MATPADSAQLSSVGFPTSESSRIAPQPIPLIRPFRRISLPSFPHPLHRNSVASVSSFDSLPEAQQSQPWMVVSTSIPGNIRLTRPPANASKSRPISVESPKRRMGRRSSSVKPLDDAKALQRKQVIDEFYATEKTYVNGLELIYSHFLTPIITSLETPNPLLDRASLTSVFSNFVDIWNLHRSFLSALTDHLGQGAVPHPSSLSPVLLSHFPYLSLYNPFITSFPSMISTLTDMVTAPSAHRPNPRYNPTFATFVSTRESDPRCGKLKLRDWLLTIVQRCPRYLLLLKDLIKYTEEYDPERTKLHSVFALVTKITSTLDTSLQNHAQILSLLTLQRSTSGLPFQLIEPGRTLLKRGPLLHIERSSTPREREFLLFSDCFVWLANEENERAWSLGWSTSIIGDSSSSNPQTPARPKLAQDKSRSEVELNEEESGNGADGLSASLERHTGVVPPLMKKPAKPLPPVPRRYPSTGEEKWVFKGQSSLVDIEVIVVPPREVGEERRFEVLSTEGSFVLYAGSEDERGEWVSEIRQAKAQLLASLNMTNPNSTLTSSSSTNHVRRSLQALPFPPSDERIATIRAVQGVKDVTDSVSPDQKGKENSEESIERRRKVEHWVPAIWIPDEKTDSCMRCGRSFNWRRRRHHCRLCGRCVCASCSGRTFFISDSSTNGASSKPARACEACYETVFPLIDPPTNPGSPTSPNSSSFLSGGAGTSQPSNDTITSLSKLPSWVSMPSLPTQGSQPQALMVDLDLSLDLDSEDAPNANNPLESGIIRSEEREIEGGKGGRVRLKSQSRPKSYHQILEDFQYVQQGRQPGGFPASPSALIDSAIEENPESIASEGEDGGGYDPTLPLPRSVDWSSQPNPSPRRRKEDTARRSKRFSLPAVALHTTNITARTTSMASGGSSGTGNGGNGHSSGISGANGSSGKENANGIGVHESGVVGRLRRLSLVSGARGPVASSDTAASTDDSVAASKLTELLAKVGR
ncbi:hypothetical protein P691DRAFT_400037 [Macrolepiota fuliginosa MF-IS2]|uniref:FYVE-domain-containing protein n=1 Tax=Macrolepiota fuliginosa MF-IS2 TaxID=1400762 RepID=A0A9P6C3W9_9AGAR|nr:hypothetical protein P691DRAFT_400037 [Macrolepiota fuliginosa MF-IS2]